MIQSRTVTSSLTPCGANEQWHLKIRDASSLAVLPRYFCWDDEVASYCLSVIGVQDELLTILTMDSIMVYVVNDEAWKVDGKQLLEVPVATVQGYSGSHQGILFWDYTDAVYVSHQDIWDTGRIAFDELTFPKKSSGPIVRGTGFDAQIQKVVEVVLDLESRRVLSHAYL